MDVSSSHIYYINSFPLALASSNYKTVIRNHILQHVNDLVLSVRANLVTICVSLTQTEELSLEATFSNMWIFLCYQ